MQRAALDELHGKVALPLVLPDFTNRHDARMIQPRYRLGLGAETLLILRRREVCAVAQHLQRDDAMQRSLPRAKNHARRAACDFTEENVVAEIADAVAALRQHDHLRRSGEKLGRRARPQ